MSEKDEHAEYMMEQFAKDKFYFSYSSMQKLMNDPLEFYKDYVLKDKEDLDKTYFKEGQLFHCFVLEPENYDNLFVTMSSKVPGGGVKNVIDRLFKEEVVHKIQVQLDAKNSTIMYETLDLYTDEILSILEEEDLYQTLTDAKRADKDGLMLTGNQKRLTKVVTQETLSYFQVLQEGLGKTVVDMAMVNKAKTKSEIMLNNKVVQDLMYSSTMKTDIRKEIELTSECTDMPFAFGLKGIVDLLRIDYEKAEIHIVDFKTTSKTMQDWHADFHTSKYLYWLQVMVYRELVLGLIPGDDKSKWTIKASFPVIDKNNAAFVFSVSDKSFAEWGLKAKGVFEIADWHLKTQNFNLPYEFEMGLVEL